MLVEDFIRILNNSNIIGYYIYQNNGIIVEANDCMAAILGFNKKSELLGKNIKDFLYENRSEMETIIRKRTQGEKLLKEYHKYTFIGKDGALVYTDAITYTVSYKNKFSGFALVVDKTKEFSYLKLYKFLSYINKLIIESSDEKEVLKKTCDILVDIIGYTVVGFGIIDRKTKNLNMLYSRSKNIEAAFDLIKLHINVETTSNSSQGTVFHAYKKNKIVTFNNVQNRKNMLTWKNFFKKYNIHSACSIPIKKDGKIKYILLIDDSYKDSFDDKHLSLMTRIKLDLEFLIQKVNRLKKIELLDKAIESSHEWFIITDNDGYITYCNDSVEQISGYNKSQLIGKKTNIFKSGLHDLSFYKNLWDTIKSGKIFSSRIINKREDGSFYHLEKIIVPIREHGDIVNFVDLSKDVTQLVYQEKKLEFQLKIYNTLYNMLSMYIELIDTKDFTKKLLKIISEKLDIPLVILFKQYKSEKTDLSFYIKENSDLNESVINNLTNYILTQNLFNKEIICIKNLDINYFSIILSLNKNDFLFEGLILIIPWEYENFTDFFELLLKEVKLLVNHLEQKNKLSIINNALKNSFDMVIITDPDFNILQIEENMREKSFIKNTKKLQGKHISEFSDIFEDSIVYKNLKTTIIKEGSLSKFVNFYDINGNIKKFYTTIVAHFENKIHKNFIFLCNQLSNETKLIDELDKFLNYDSTTGLINAKSFQKNVVDYLDSIFNKNTIFGIVIINHLNFGEINRAFGFNAGNLIISEIGERIKKVLRNYDIIAKLESDRFGILLKDLINENDIMIVINKIKNELLNPFHIKESTIQLNFTFGVVIYPKDGKNYDELIHRTHIALLDAKFKKDKIGFYSKTLEISSKKRLELKTHLKKALDNNEIRVFYQPYVDKDGNIVGAESLLRWFKDGELVPTGSFIEYLESINLIIDIEHFVFEEVINCTRKIPIPFKFAINISKQTLTNSSTITKLSSLLNNNDIRKSSLIFEIVERIYVDDFDEVVKVINSISKLGIDFSLDDFGTGFSSLTLLANLPLKSLKIDLMFVREIPHNDKILNLIKSIIFMAKQLNLKVIAEGVETSEQFKILKELGCDYFQGFYFYKPMCKEDLLSILENICNK
ncbi:EAL domain-containing protein [Deferribacter abyssi]|uniref:EAL domain-containing protein n=1 Tax=Deferribacter abyssi TaxID=213806 RepID=UPI003C20BB57